jgi:hypothetical protein
MAPRGHTPGLHIEHRPTGRGGPFDARATHHKGILHTTQGSNVESMHDVLVGKEAEPHFLFGREGSKWRVIQYIPLNEGSSRALEHPLGPLPTNNAKAIQIEVAGFAVKDARHDWSEDTYLNLSVLMLMIENRVPIAVKRGAIFSATPHRPLRATSWLPRAGSAISMSPRRPRATGTPAPSAPST